MVKLTVILKLFLLVDDVLGLARHVVEPVFASMNKDDNRNGLLVLLFCAKKHFYNFRHHLSITKL